MAAYASLHVIAVGRAAAFAEACRSDPGPGSLQPVLPPGSTCDDDTTGHHGAEWLGRGTAAVCFTDDTPLNAVFTAASVAHLFNTGGDSDCTQKQYKLHPEAVQNGRPLHEGQHDCDRRPPRVSDRTEGQPILPPPGGLPAGHPDKHEKAAGCQDGSIGENP